MAFRVVITGRAVRDMTEAAQWWARERSVEEAARWIDGLERELRTLAPSPLRCSLIAEHKQFSQALRELHFGLGSRRTHRAIFAVSDDVVLVLAVRHERRDGLHPDDLA